jgi:hypothetical protein
MHLPHSIAIRPNLELKTQPKQLLGSLPLDITLPGSSLAHTFKTGLKRLTVQNTRAYYDAELITVVKSFTVQTLFLNLLMKNYL